MNRDYEEEYHRYEESHWWLRARRDIVLSLFLKLRPDRTTRALEIGCSSGVLLRRLAREGFESVTGIDISAEAILASQKQGTTNARVMDAQRLGFSDKSFDIITASDVLEHIKDDEEALREWFRVLTPGGHLIVFVPAFRSLWSEHDVANQHHRRYRASELAAKAKAAGFTVLRTSYWNVVLFPPVALVRLAKRVLGWRGPGSADSFFPPPAAPVNAGLRALLAFENKLLEMGMKFPFGVSTMMVARKP
jgi:2-polyprenyl-3-methyl-5-hydroxy-6-metoxy-1,4-benzoquinol methylase